MYCQSCGHSLSKQTKFCNRCGAQLTVGDESSKERLDEYLTGLFWITVFGLGLILGGLALMKQVQLNDGIIAGFLALSSLAFIINFWLNLAEILRMRKSSIKEERVPLEGRLDTNELGPEEPPLALESPASVTENTTRTLEPASKQQLR
jgi:hypothetical protein